MNEYPKIELSPVVSAEQEEKTSKEVAAVLGARLVARHGCRTKRKQSHNVI